MNISQTITCQLEHSSWIRRMFEEGARMKQQRGAENVYDFTLGNPDVEPPAVRAHTATCRIPASPRSARRWRAS